MAGLIFLSAGCGNSVAIFGRNAPWSSYSTVRSANDPRYATATQKGYNFGTAAPSFVTVRKGDTVYALSRRYNVPTRALIETNRIKPPFLLSPGQKLRLPLSSAHTVQKGETIYSISRKYNVDMSTLARQNKIAWPYSIFPGQTLNLPGSIVIARQDSISVRQSKSSWSSSSAKQYTPAKSTRSAANKNTARLPEPPSRSKGMFAWPLRGKLITTFGPAGAGRHNDGINIRVAEGTIVKASENGVVAYAGNELKGFGNLLLVKHSDGWMTAYAHNKEFLVKRGQTVKRGQPMAKVGKSGNAKEPQLHFEVRRGTKAVDPLAYLER